jgi:hypothetical protein
MQESMDVYKKYYLRMVFENRVLRGIFRVERDEILGGWRKLHNDELHDVISTLHVIRMINSRRMI